MTRSERRERKSFVKLPGQVLLPFSILLSIFEGDGEIPGLNVNCSYGGASNGWYGIFN